MALYNVQEYIENPFDQKGLDDLKIDQLAVENSEGIYDWFNIWSAKKQPFLLRSTADKTLQ